MGTDRTSNGDIAPMFTATDAAALLLVHARTIHRLAKAGKLPGAVYVGRALRFRRRELLAFVDGGGLGLAKVA